MLGFAVAHISAVSKLAALQATFNPNPFTFQGPCFASTSVLAFASLEFAHQSAPFS